MLIQRHKIRLHARKILNNVQPYEVSSSFLLLLEVLVFYVVLEFELFYSSQDYCLAGRYIVYSTMEFQLQIQIFSYETAAVVSPRKSTYRSYNMNLLGTILVSVGNSFFAHNFGV